MQAAALVKRGSLSQSKRHAAEAYAEAALLVEEDGHDLEAAILFRKVLDCVPGDDEAFHRLAKILTNREEELLQLIADGLATSEVATSMYISQKTVKNHLASIYEKLQARDRTQAVLTAVKMGIVKLT